MTASLRVSLYAVVLATVLIGKGYADPEWAGALAQAVQALPELVLQIAEQRRACAGHEDRTLACFRAAEAKEQTVRDLLARRLTLVEAADRFRQVNVGLSGSGNRFLGLFPGRTDEERLCRQVISWAYGELAQRAPDEAEMAAVLLELELQEHLDHHGMVGLPD
jgi:hypothetical protein